MTPKLSDKEKNEIVRYILNNYTNEITAYGE